MKISIVTSYYNRKNLLINTLKSISTTKHNDYEFIIVDDGSSDENRIEDLVNEFPFIKVLRVNPKDKWYLNPCVPFNKAFKEAKGDIIIIQNPECFHTSDIISFVDQNLTENDYFVFGCYSIDEEKTKILTNESHKNFVYNNIGASFDGDDAWYNHSIYRPVGYHFASAIFKSKLTELNGFDERYAFGYGYDDNEFLHRVRKICNLKMIDNHLILHQYHYNLNTMNKTQIKYKVDNRKLFFKTTLFEDKIKVNI